MYKIFNYVVDDLFNKFKVLFDIYLQPPYLISSVLKKILKLNNSLGNKQYLVLTILNNLISGYFFE